MKSATAVRARCVRYAVESIAAIAFLIVPAVALAQSGEPKADPKGELAREEQIFERQSKLTDEADEDVVGREEWFDFQRRYPYDHIPDGLREEAVRYTRALGDRLEEMAAKGRGTPLSSSSWENVGPINQGGRTRAIAVDPDDPQVIYVGGADGGVWKTTDAGSTWTPTFDGETALTIGAIAIDPTNTSIVYAGTGEIAPAVDITYRSDGIFKSTDGGGSWTNMGLNSLGTINRIWVRSDNPQVLYVASGRSFQVNDRDNLPGAATGRGFYRSTDGGESWTKIIDGAFYDMAVNPANEDEVWLVQASQVFRSTDGGLNFSRRDAGISVSAPLRASIGISAADPSTVYVLIAHVNSANLHDGDLWVSTNSGESWSLRHQFGDKLFSTIQGQGNYDNCIGVDPFNVNTVMCGGIRGYISYDGGNTFNDVTTPANVHVDQHTIVFDPNVPGLIYLGNDGGVFTTFDGTNWGTLNEGLAITQFYTVEVDQTRPTRLYGGTQDNNTQGTFGTGSVDPHWQVILGGDGFHAVVDKTDPNVLYCEAQYGSLFRVNVQNGPGAPTKMVNADIEDGYWSTPLAQSPVDNTLYSGRRLLYANSSPRSSVTWSKMTVGNQTLMSSVACSPFDANKVIVGKMDGRVYFTTDHGATWAQSSGTPGRFCSYLKYDPVDQHRVLRDVLRIQCRTCLRLER